MDAHYCTDVLLTMPYASENDGTSKLTPEQLRLKEIKAPAYFNSRIIEILESCTIKHRLKHNELLVEPSVYGEHESTIHKITSDRAIKKMIPDHCLLSFKYSEKDIMTPILLKSHRLNEDIIDGVVFDSLPIAYLSVSTDEHEHSCMHVASNQIALTSLSKSGQPRFLTTTHVRDCHAVVFWDKSTQTAIMSHFMQNDMCEPSFDFMLSKITQYAPIKDIKTFIVGGIVERMRDSGNFFAFAEKYLDKKSITLTQTFLGDKKRPTDLLFDSKEGTFYELKFLNKGRYPFSLIDHRKDSAFSFKNADFDEITFNIERTYYYSSENKKHFIPINLYFPPS